MEQEDIKIKQLFEEYQPELKSDEEFMKGVISGIDAIDICRTIDSKGYRSNKKAAVFSGLAGLLSGIILTLLFPVISSFFKTFIVGIQKNIMTFYDVSLSLEVYTSVLSYCFISLCSLIVIFSVFKLLTSIPQIQK